MLTYAEFKSTHSWRDKNRYLTEIESRTQREIETEKGATRAAAAPALIINSNGQSLPIKVVFASERTLFIASSPSGNDAKVGMEEKLNWQSFKVVKLKNIFM